MSKVLGIISCNYQFNKIHELNQNRPIAALPFGGRYAIVDFPLSNMVNAGITSVGIVMPSDYRPILDHIRSGKSWSLNRKSGGLFILPGMTVSLDGNNKFPIKDFRKNIDFLKREKAEYIVISGSNSVINIDLAEVIEEHQLNQADVTLIYKEQSKVNCDELACIVKLDDKGQVTDMVKSGTVDFDSCRIFTDQLIIGRELLLRLLTESYSGDELSLIDLVKNRTKELKVCSYEFNGYYASIFSKETYFKANMSLMEPAVVQQLFHGNNKIVTRTKDNPPTKYSQEANIKDSLVSSGCLINGQLEKSLLFRGVKVEKGARIKNSIIMHDCQIGQDVVLENVILDKSVVISPGIEIIGHKDSPTFIPKFKSL
ncbi:MAG: glucose-1-phosphate adenylyltransferase subunit GlgD [Fusobacteria bacterium]|nr:glucose-1-phosphate adenylyltransferase subunit GlgD [Fusobacteriota bacterium]